jgi:hypothetical protein
MRGIHPFYRAMALILGVVLGPATACASPITGAFSGTVTSAEASAFFGEWAGVPASDFHPGDAISGTFAYDPALFTGQAVGPLTTTFTGGTLHFDWQIGSHHFSFEGPLSSPAGPMNAVTLSIFAAPPQSFNALALDYVGDLQDIYTDYAVSLRFSGLNLFGDHNDLASLNFAGVTGTLDFGATLVNAQSSGTTQLSEFAIDVVGSLPVANAVTPIPPSLFLFLSGVVGLALVTRLPNLRSPSCPITGQGR